MFDEDNEQSLIATPALTILQHANICEKIKALGDRRLLGADFIKISSNKYGETLYDLSNPTVVINFIKTYSKLEKMLNALDKTQPQIARQAATVLIKQLATFCQHYETPTESYQPHLSTRTHNPFSSVDHSSITISLVQPSQALETLETELTSLLRPVAEINPIAKAALATGCMLVGIALSITLSIFVSDAVLTFIPGLQPSLEAMSLGLSTGLDLALGNHAPLLSMPNAISAGVGGLLGAGAGFFAIRKIQQSRSSPFHDCMKATRALQEKLDSTKTDEHLHF